MTAATLEAHVIELVAALPDLAPGDLRALAAGYRIVEAASPPGPAALARAIAMVLERYLEGRAPLEGWGLVASAAHTLTRALAGDAHAVAGLPAACFEIDSLALPDGPRPAAVATPDVPTSALRRRT